MLYRQYETKHYNMCNGNVENCLQQNQFINTVRAVSDVILLAEVVIRSDHKIPGLLIFNDLLNANNRATYMYTYTTHTKYENTFWKISLMS